MTAGTLHLPLADQDGFGRLFRAYLSGDGSVPVAAAAAELAAFLDPGDGAARVDPAPAWAAAAWVEPWRDRLLADMPDPASAETAAAGIAALRAGDAEAVITGQQPGFLGGPLYALYKAAAAVAAARMRTAAGRPTVPVFWSGDDDDDRQEAFSARVWDFARGGFLKPVPPAGASDEMIGAAAAAEWGAAGAAWLAGFAGTDGLADELARVWAEGAAAGLSWSAVQRRALLRLLRGTGLLIVSGNDPGLHELAEPLYRRWLRDGRELAAAAADRGAELAAAGGHAQLAEAALRGNLNREEGGRRLRLDPEAAAGIPAAALRPGVALRSPLQDWLFRPAGVIAGPGEVAYLEQLRPVYALLDIHRPPLLPRLFAALSADPARAAAARGDSGSADEISGRSAAAVAAAGEALRRSLAGNGVEKADADDIARRLDGRWREDVAAGLLRLRRASGGRAAAPPPWEDPPGGRQERRLAVYWAAAYWGDDLVAAVLAAAEDHFRFGLRGDWRDFLLPVAPVPA